MKDDETLFPDLKEPEGTTPLRAPSACRAFYQGLQAKRSYERRLALGQEDSRSSSGHESSTMPSEKSKPHGPVTSYMAAVNDNGRAIGEDHPGARYTDGDVERVRELRAEGYSLADIGRIMDMPIRTVRSYLDGSRRSQSVAGWKKVRRWK